jgi:ABC-2 type transport system permease protein
MAAATKRAVTPGGTPAAAQRPVGTPAPVSGHVSGRASARASVRRMRALGRAELKLLWRNRTALAYALLLPPLAFLFAGQSDAFAIGDGVGAMIVTAVAVLAIGMAVYYNLVTAYVGRREEFVLKRLRTGELSDGEILAGTALPSLVLAWVQVVVAVGVAVAIGELPVPANALLVVLAMVVGSLVFPLLAAATSALTRTVEMAQVTTTPVLLVPLVLCGLFAPVRELPTGFSQVAQVMPLTPVVDLMRLGFLGLNQAGERLDTMATFAAAVPSLAVGGGWVLIGVWATRRWFRWEPRR